MIFENEQKIYKIEDEVFHCGTAVGFRFIGGKWKSVILWYLRRGKLRFSEIKKLIPDTTDKMLSIQLTALENDGLVKRKKYGVKPPFRVEYELTHLGESLIPVIKAITDWGITYAEKYGELIEASEIK